MHAKIKNASRKPLPSSFSELIRIMPPMAIYEEGESFENLDPDVQTAILAAEAQSSRSEGRPWKKVREELRKRFLSN